MCVYVCVCICVCVCVYVPSSNTEIVDEGLESNPSLLDHISSHRRGTFTVQWVLQHPRRPDSGTAMSRRRVMMRHHGEFHQQADAGARKSLVEGREWGEKKLKPVLTFRRGILFLSAHEEVAERAGNTGPRQSKQTRCPR